MAERVVDEVMFWRKNLREMNGWNMRNSKDVVYCKEGCVNMFLDASNVQVAGVRFESEESVGTQCSKWLYLRRREWRVVLLESSEG